MVGGSGKPSIRPTQPFILTGSINRVPTCGVGVKTGRSPLSHCWLGHLTRKIVSEMTYNVSSGTLNTTIPYYTIPPLSGDR